MTILITGGAGYIGSHTCVELLTMGHEIVIIDNLSNSSPEVINRIKKITGKNLRFFEGDLIDKVLLDNIFTSYKINCVIHFAGLKAVGESVSNPLRYYINNLGSTLVLLETMHKYNVKKLVFSSSATIYGDPKSVPIQEDAVRSATNPYGQTKLMIEQILEDLVASHNGWSITSLRYFNPIGAHDTGLIGEDPQGTPNNLLPYISQVAVGKLKKLKIFGNNYDTADGTGVRDYIHVVDLAKAHLSAMDNIEHPDVYKVYNIGTNIGTSVLQLVHAFEQASGKEIPYEIVDRRRGDIASCYSDVTKAKNELNWEALYSLQDSCASAWKWQSNNPLGFKTK